MTKRLSASRLNEYLACAHAAALWLDGVEPPEQQDPALELVRKKGFEHEALVLQTLEARFGKAAAIPEEATPAERAEATRAAIAAGAPLIYQAALFNARWVGVPDFLVKVGEGLDGAPIYEPEDAKLARSAKAEHVLQLGIYRRLLGDFGATPGPMGAIHVGGGGEPQRFKLLETEHITGRYMAEFEAFADAPQRQRRPLPTSACDRCAFQPRCEAEWRAADSPTFVAGLRSDQLLKLEKAGVGTLEALATLGQDARVPGIGEETLRKLIAQARLQAQARKTGAHVVEPLAPEPRRGFALLPPPAPGDLFFDMEGYPHDPGGLEYLFGLYGPLGEGGEDKFLGIWAHDSAAEKRAFEELMDLFCAHLQRYPAAHIYHYAAYETVALKKLASRYATREAELDTMLREQRFVDLYRVAKQGLRASTESYSLKALEKIYWGQRAGEVTTAGDSIVEYERWRETRDPAILEAIERYNEDDCVSTAKLRDWLEGLRPEGAAYGLAQAEDEVREADAKREARQAFEQQRRELAAKVRASGVGTEPFRELAAELLWFHQRANKPQWWALFDRQTWSDEELIDDIEGLGGLRLVSQETLPKPARSDLATYRFPPQETKLRKGQSCRIAENLEPAGVIEALDPAAGTIVLKRGSKNGPFPEACGLSPEGPVDQQALVSAVIAFAERVAAGDLGADQALMDLLLRAPPRIAGRAPGSPIIAEGEDLVEGVVRAVRGLEGSYLFIQGPPGTGKTYTSSKAILELLKDGRRVAVSSNSHKAINNLLSAVEARAEEDGFTFRGAKKATRGDPDSEMDGRLIGNVYSSGDGGESFQLVGGTAFHFCKSEQAFDYLFIDEAGQVCLANLVAMAHCARNIVLIGDQMQLPQPVQGVHPGETGLSCLEYLLGDRATVPPESGVLLNISWRMHPKVCQLISDAVYDGRLSAHSRTATRAILNAGGLPEAGVLHVPVAHEGCRQASREEAEEVERLLERLLKGGYRDEDGRERPLTLEDVLIVAPYNLQVNLLKERLPSGARVGTVDKFQGQEAPVVIVSMATSRGSEAPRGTEFLFNKNRLNVAISRAKCLALVVSSDQLLDGGATTIEDLVRLDLLARVEKAGEAVA